MYSYKTIPKFDPYTGKPAHPTFTRGSKICDYSGNVIDEEILPGIEYEIKIEYISGCEEPWYYDDDREEFETLGIEYDSIFSSPYHFESNREGQDYSSNLLDEWNKNFDNKDSIFYHCTNLDLALRICRIRTIKKLLKENKFSIEELGLVKYEDFDSEE